MTRVAIVGASGFVGRALTAALARDEVVAISRSRPADLPAHATFRETDLFSAESTWRALEGVDVAVYLVHSMMPSSRLFQGDFHDTDLILADNFARAAVERGVRRIVYLGGLMPSEDASAHLTSRHEVEGVLKATGLEVAILRAGMVVGAGGSSFEILRGLVGRLPFMILPRWTQRTTQAVFVDDVVRVLDRAIHDAALSGRTLDVVNGEALTYEKLLEGMARALGVRRTMVPVPIDSTAFSKLWVTLVARSNYALVSPLVDSLRCDLPTRGPDPLIADLIEYRSLDAMFTAVLSRPPGESGPARSRRPSSRTVRSVQRLPPVPLEDARWIAREYMRWLPRALLFLLRVETNERKVRFFLRGLGAPLLELEFVEGRFDEARQKLHIVGGLLSKTSDTGWLEFRQVEGRRYTLAAIHEFVPALPWYLYLLGQARAHHAVMTAFARHLGRPRAS